MTTWVKVYNSMPSNPKLLKAGERAGWLYVCGLCYANEHLTNGFIPRYALAVVAPGAKGAMTLAKRLVSAALWHEVEGGWRIHDYNHHQRSAEEIRDRRAADSARKAASRSAKSPHGQIADSAKNPQGVRDSPRARDRARSQDVDVEVDVEIENVKDNKAELRSAVVECFVYWQEKCGHKQARLTEDRKAKIFARLKEGYTVADIHQGIDGAARAAFVDEKGKRFDDIELICRKGSKLEDFMARAALPNGNVVAIQRPAALERMDAWRNAPEYQQGGDAR